MRQSIGSTLLALYGFFNLTAAAQCTATKSAIQNGGFDVGQTGWTADFQTSYIVSAIETDYISMNSTPGIAYFKSTPSFPVARLPATLSGPSGVNDYNLTYWMQLGYGAGACTFLTVINGQTVDSFTPGTWSFNPSSQIYRQRTAQISADLSTGSMTFYWFCPEYPDNYSSAEIVIDSVSLDTVISQTAEDAVVNGSFEDNNGVWKRSNDNIVRPLNGYAYSGSLSMFFSPDKRQPATTPRYPLYINQTLSGLAVGSPYQLSFVYKTRSIADSANKNVIKGCNLTAATGALKYPPITLPATAAQIGKFVTWNAATQWKPGVSSGVLKISLTCKPEVYTAQIQIDAVSMPLLTCRS